ncbi:hypothetical protein [Streptomyces hebeiensis]
MSAIKKNITDNFKKIENRNNITVIPAGNSLPQSGNYEIGDRVFRDDPVASLTYPSNYLLVAKSSTWGWHWRPIQTMLSPWVTVPSSCMEDSGFSLHPTFKFQIALDSKGQCHWRGVIMSNNPGITPASSIAILKFLPDGLKPNMNFMHTLAISPVTGGAGKTGYVGGRIFMRSDGYTSFRFFNTGNGLSQNIWLDGLTYPNSEGFYYGA